MDFISKRKAALNIMNNVTLQIMRSRDQEDLIKELEPKIKMVKELGVGVLWMGATAFNSLYELIVYPMPEHKKEFYWNDVLIKRVK
jgi:hypothetical protein